MAQLTGDQNFLESEIWKENEALCRLVTAGEADRLPQGYFSDPNRAL